MKLNKKIIFLCIVFCALISISAVSANDTNDTGIAVSDSDVPDQISADENVDLQATAIQEELKSTNDGETLAMEDNSVDASSSDEKITANIKASKLTTSYSSGKYFTVKLVDSSNNPVSNAKLLLKVYTGKTFKKVTLTTGSDGTAKYNPSKLAVGTHKIVISSLSNNVKASTKTTNVKITKAKLIISAPKTTNGFKQSDKFKVVVKNKATKHVISNVKVTIKVYTGKTYKTYTVKTNSKGVASINTKKLSKGSHNVVVSVKATKSINKKSAKSTIKIVNKKSTKIDVGDASTWFTANYYSSILYLTAHVALKDSNGKIIKNKDMSYVCRSGSFSGKVLDKGTFKSATDGDAYTRNMGASPGAGMPLYFTFTFKGDSKYSGSTINYRFYRASYY